jgi:hypothetical protein
MAGVTPRDIWETLEKAGASAVQAAGIMGNAIAESSLNPEARAMDSNGAYSNGLWQFNEASYPDSRELVTGNPARDLISQVNYLFAHGGLQAASGSTVAETAGNFAASFERCQGCQSGGSQYNQRQANAAMVSNWAGTASWPASSGTASDTAQLTAAQAGEQKKAEQSCLWEIGWGGIPGTSWLNRIYGLFGTSSGHGNVASGSVCLMSRAQGRAIAGTALLVTGGVVMGWGLRLVLLAAGAEALARALRPVNQVLVPPPGVPEPK